MHWPQALRRVIGARPIRWTRGAGRPAAPRAEGADIIIPVYGAASELAQCLASVVRHTDLERHALTLVIDGAQDEDVERVIATYAAHAQILRNETRRGFAGSVNRGMAASSRDVVLLNSDAIVTESWLEQLIDAAYSDGDVATVTALSNHATLCSVPRAFEENLLPTGFDVDAFAALIRRVSRRSYPRLPTAVGFCMYIRRAALDDVGLFDAVTFAGGYGEENDFSMRALGRGWLHVADDATYVHHAGHRSFGASRAARQRRSAKALARRHPRYMATIAAFMRSSTMDDVRARITRALTPPRADGERLKIVHLVHGWPPFQHAGTELYAYWLAHAQNATHDVSVYTRGADPACGDGEAVELLDRGIRVRIVTNHFTARDPLRRNAIRDHALERDFARFLREERPHLVHIHHLAGHAFSLANVARRAGVPVVMQVQDWWLLCARVNLLHRNGQRCSGPAPEKCVACATLTRVPPAPLTNRIVHALRRRAARAALESADAFIAGSHAIHRDFQNAAPPHTPFHVVPYGIALDAPRPARAPMRRPVRFGYVGSIAPHKGVHTAVAAMRGIAAADATLHLWGDASAYPDYVRDMHAGENVVFEGSFAEAAKGDVFAAMDVLLVPSIGLESFGLAAREAMASGVPIVATSGGALSEMFAPGDCGEFFPPGDATALHAILGRIARDPSIVDRWVARLPQPKTEAAHALEIERIYADVLASRKR